MTEAEKRLNAKIEAAKHNAMIYAQIAMEAQAQADAVRGFVEDTDRVMALLDEGTIEAFEKAHAIVEQRATGK